MRVLRKPEVVNRVGFSAVHIWRLEKRGVFPRRFAIGANSVGWLEFEIDAWIAARAAERDGEAAAA